MQASDFGTNYGSDVFGIPGTNGPDPRQSGFPGFATGLGNADGIIGNAATWHPLERHETSYTFTQTLTKLAGKHEFRAGFDFIRYQLDHWQPELGDGPRGRFNFSGNLTGQPGYVANAWNQYAGFLLGLTSGYGKSIQFETMTGRENQYAFYVGDRWTVSDKLTLTAGLRYEYYPLMMRSDRGIERLDYTTWNVLLGGVGNVPDDLGIQVSKNLWAPRLGAAYRLNEKTVLRAGYGITYNPIPWSRPLRGFYPLTIGYTNAITNSYDTFALAAGIPTIPLPDVSSGSVPLPRGVQTRTPTADNVERGRTQQYNLTVEREVFADISVSVAYVGTRTDGGYADVNANYAEAGGNANRIYFAQAGTAPILEWGSITRSRYNSLQMAVNRPFKNGLLLKGAYTWSKAMNETDEDGWATKTWSQPSQMERNYAKAGYDRTHIFQMGFVYELPFAKNARRRRRRAGEGLVDQRHCERVLGDAVHDCRRQHGAEPAGRAADDPADRRHRAAGRRGAGCAVLRPGGVCAAGQPLGQHGAQLPARAEAVEPRPGGVQGRELRRALPRRVPGAGDQRAEPHALGQPGDRLHGSQLPADPHQRSRRQRPAQGPARAPLPVLVWRRVPSGRAAAQLESAPLFGSPWAGSPAARAAQTREAIRTEPQIQAQRLRGAQS